MSRKLLLLSLLPMLPAAAAAAEWTFELEPYIMATSISGDTSVGRVTGVEVDVDMSDILENLEMAAMLHFEAHSSGGWGFALDYGFMDLGADISAPLGGVIDADLRQGVLEALVMRRTEMGGGQLDIMGGFRWWDNDIDIQVDPAIWPGTVDFGVKEDWFDLVVGARFTKPIGERWKMQLRGDVGGLGLEADFTSTLGASFRFAMTQSIELDLQYRATWVDYESGSRGDPGYFQYDTVTHGPVIGVNFKF